MENLGIIRQSLSGDLYNILQDDINNIYICKNVDSFLQASSSVQFNQKVHRVISNVLFTTNSVLYFDNHSVDYKSDLLKLEAIFIEIFENDFHLRNLINLCAGADCSDLHIFKFITKITDWNECPLFAGGLKNGLGFHGSSLSIFKAFNLYYPDEFIVYFQSVESYSEGYSIRHFEIPLNVIKTIQQVDFISNYLQF